MPTWNLVNYQQADPYDVLRIRVRAAVNSRLPCKVAVDAELEENSEFCFNPVLLAGAVFVPFDASFIPSGDPRKVKLDQRSGPASAAGMGS